MQSCMKSSDVSLLLIWVDTNVNEIHIACSEHILMTCIHNPHNCCQPVNSNVVMHHSLLPVLKTPLPQPISYQERQFAEHRTSTEKEAFPSVIGSPYTIRNQNVDAFCSCLFNDQRSCRYATSLLKPYVYIAAKALQQVRKFYKDRDKGTYGNWSFLIIETKSRTCYGQNRRRILFTFIMYTMFAEYPN